ncbi:nucleotidyltransferase [Cohnella pontilimi]|uniref:Nucleotidyltransferase n=1 Tax=Cohnella pontilimi TaxID=2564100 RepID=A0A4V6WEH4_9BACL|nr:nucleotidyltransferase family protein [Cohnella pontilimi]TJY42459.1 nucleotidyltransferase [Cohnella pontilimi]
MRKSDVEYKLKQQKEYLASHFFVNKIGIFGSYARDEQTEESDIDLLVEFSRPVGFEFIELKYYLESIFNKPVDLVTANALKPLMKEQVLNEVQYQ